MMKRIFFVEDHPLLARGFSSQLAEYFGNQFELKTSGSLAESLTEIRASKPDYIFVDHQLQDGTGLQLVEELKDDGFNFILMSQIDRKEILTKYLELGVKAIISKNDSAEVVNKIFSQDKFEFIAPVPFISPYYAEILKRKSASDYLTEQELKVLALVARGLTNKEVGLKLDCSEFTIKTHKTNIMRKLGINNSVGLSVWALKNQVI